LQLDGERGAIAQCRLGARVCVQPLLLGVAPLAFGGLEKQLSGFDIGEVFGRQLARGLQLASQRSALRDRRFGTRVCLTTLALDVPSLARSGFEAQPCGFGIDEPLFGRLVRGFGTGDALFGRFVPGFCTGDALFGRFVRGLELGRQGGALLKRRLGARLRVSTRAIDFGCLAFDGFDAQFRGFEIGASLLGGIALGFGVGELLFDRLTRGLDIGESLFGRFA